MLQYGEQMGLLPRTNVRPRQPAVVAGLDTACATVRRQAARPATHLIPQRPEPAMQRPGVVLRRGWREVIKCEAPLPISCIRCWEQGVRHGQGCQHCHFANPQAGGAQGRPRRPLRTSLVRPPRPPRPPTFAQEAPYETKQDLAAARGRVLWGLVVHVVGIEAVAGAEVSIGWGCRVPIQREQGCSFAGLGLR
jgi:hypothetical protein